MISDKAKRATATTIFLLSLVGTGIIIGNIFIPSPQKIFGDTKGQFVNHYFEQASHSHTRLNPKNETCIGTQGISMAPAVFPGNTLCYEPYSNRTGAVEGEIIIYTDKPGGHLIGHAVITKTYVNGSLAYITKGYNNKAEDPEPVPEENIVGIATQVKYS
jgi:hypothetical protein